ADALSAVAGAPAAAVPPGQAKWVGWVVRNVTRPVGDVFLNLLFMAIIPLVFASLAVGVTRLGGGSHVGRVGMKTIGYFLITTACAAAIGLTLVNAIRPGDRIPPEQKERLLGRDAEDAGKKVEREGGVGSNRFGS